jgi:hypothetical protein
MAGGGGRENGWVNKILWVEMGGLNKNSPNQGVGKIFVKYLYYFFY